MTVLGTPDGNEDWRLEPQAVREVKRLREESDAEIAKLETQLAESREEIAALERSRTEALNALVEVRAHLQQMTEDRDRRAEEWLSRSISPPVSHLFRLRRGGHVQLWIFVEDEPMAWLATL